MQQDPTCLKKNFSSVTFGKRPFKDNFDKLGQEKAITVTEDIKNSESGDAGGEKPQETEEEAIEEKK